MRRTGIGGLLLAGLAAWGAYKYSKMSDDDKSRLKERGKRFIDDNLGNLKNSLGRGGTQNAAHTRGEGFSRNT